MIAIDPIEALAFVREHPSMNQAAFISHVLTSWIRDDAEPAIDYFKSLTNQALKLQIGARLLEDPFLSDSGHLPAIEAELGTQAEQISERIRLSRLSPQSAFEEALASTDLRRQPIMMRAITRWYQQDPDQGQPSQSSRQPVPD